MAQEDKGKVSLPPAILARLRDEEQRLLTETIAELVRRAREVDVIDVWNTSSLVSSYWVLLMSGPDQEDEIKLATDLLRWHHFSARAFSQVVCLSPAETRLFTLLTSRFAVSKLPTLLLSIEPAMERVVRVEPALLHELSEARGGFRKVLSEIQVIVNNSEGLEAVAAHLQREEFLRQFKRAYKELKSLVSISMKMG